jgi:hypothetical protein
MPLFANYLERHARDPFPPQLSWEAADPDWGQCRWIVIDSLIESTPSAWHKDINLTMVDSSIVWGFQLDTSYIGNGVQVGRMVGGGNLAVMLGLRPGGYNHKNRQSDYHKQCSIRESQSRYQAWTGYQRNDYSKWPNNAAFSPYPRTDKLRIVRPQTPFGKSECYLCGEQNRYRIIAGRQIAGAGSSGHDSSRPASDNPA